METYSIEAYRIRGFQVRVDRWPDEGSYIAIVPATWHQARQWIDEYVDVDHAPNCPWAALIIRDELIGPTACQNEMLLPVHTVSNGWSGLSPEFRTYKQ